MQPALAHDMTIGSLFAGIGGLELGLERAGVGRVVWQVEIDEVCRSVLAKWWPDAERFEDVRTVGKANLAAVDVVCGGFPCTDISVAGRGGGLRGERSGLWYEFARIVGELRPRFVVVENVAHGRARWLSEVRSQLHDLGYCNEAHLVSASDVGAPHRRDRCFVVAYADSESVRQLAERRPARRARSVRGQREAFPLDDGDAWRASGTSPWATLPALLGVDDGLPLGLHGRAAVDRERALGNAVVPAVAEAIGRRVMQIARSQ